MKGFRILTAVVIAGVLMLAGSAAANAHAWRSAGGLGTPFPTLQGDPTVPGTADFLIFRGAFEWEAQGHGPDFFVKSDNNTTWSVSSAPSAGLVGYSHQPIDGAGGTLAEAWTWSYAANPDIAYSSIVRFDSAETWFDGTGIGIGGTQFDRWGTSTHEMGHVVGLAHMAAGSQWCSSAPIVTSVMCPSTLPGFTNIRIPYAIDWGSFAEIYGSP